MNLENGLAYDDILLRPRRSDVRSRDDPVIESPLIGDIKIDVPIVSAPMDSVTEQEMAQTLADEGAVGIIHRFLDPEDQARQVSNVDGLVGASVGVDGEWFDRTELLIENGVDFVCIDVAHGHSELCIEAIEEIDQAFEIPIMAGNVSTGQGAVDLVKAGADAVKIGVGPGSHCLTREVAGVGVPQVTAIDEVVSALDDARKRKDIDEDYVPVVADGGIQTSGDISKALTLGADTVMIGGLFGGCSESPAQLIYTKDGNKYKQTRGMASDEAREKNDMTTSKAAEGDSGLTPYKGTAENMIDELSSGLKTSFSYLGAHNISEARSRATFLKVSPSVQNRNGTHGVFTNNN